MDVNVGDIVYDSVVGIEDGCGIVVDVDRSVEIPPAVTIYWDNGQVTKAWCDDIAVLCKTDDSVVEYKGRETI